jgi:mannosyltransferase
LGIGAAAAYFAITGLIAARRPFWNDELFTYYIAMRPSLRDVWSFLLTGAEQLPLLFYIVTRADISIFGSSEFALRLPALIGLAVAALSVYWFASRRVSPIHAASGAFFLLCTSSYEYAFEARPYGLVLGFLGLAFVAWQHVTEEHRARGFALIALALTLIAAIHSHYYATLALGPLCAGELVRDIVRRRIDLRVWVSLVLPLATLAPLSPLIRAASTFEAKFWSRPSLLTLFNTWGALINHAVPAIVLVVLVGGAFATLNPAPLIKRIPIPLHEVFAVTCLALLPIENFVVARLVTNAYNMRYVLAATIGFGILVAWMLNWSIGARTGPSRLILLLIGACWISTAIMAKRNADGAARDVRGLSRFLESTGSDLPVAIAEPLIFFRLSHYASPELARRLVYLSDVQIGTRRTGTDTVERGLLALKEIAPLHVVGYREFVGQNRAFLVYSSPGLAWTVPQLHSDHRRMEIVDLHSGGYLLRIMAVNSAGQ